MKQRVTEEEAKTKWCRYRDGNCIASECMDWTWKIDGDDIFLDNYVEQGCCGANN